MTTKQRLFSDHYLSNGFNATQAALSAGYSKKTAYSIGEQNLKKVEIKSYISKRVKELLSDTEMASLKILKALDEIIDCDLGDYVQIKTELSEDQIDERGGVIPGREIQRVVFNDTAELNTKVLSEISEGQHGIKIKAQDRLKAIELKGKYLSLWADGINLNNPETDKQILTKEQRRDKILKLSSKLNAK